MKNTNFKKILFLALTLLLSITLMTPKLYADTAKTVSVTLHKVAFDSPDKDKVENTGEEMNDFGGKPLQGAEFTVYDITEAYHELLTDSKTDGEAIEARQKTVIETIQKNVSDYTKTEKTKEVTDEKGEAVFSNLELKSKDKDAVYLFVETKTPADPSISVGALPIVLAMPIYKVDGELNTDIHLYPKNTLIPDTKYLTKVNDKEILYETNGDSVVNVTTGDIIDYEINVHIPYDIKKHESYSLTDTPTNGLEIVSIENIVVKVGTTELQIYNDYTIDKTKYGGFTINLREFSFDKTAGRKLIITYQMKLTDKVDVEQVSKNSAQVTVGSTTQSEMKSYLKPKDGENPPTDPVEVVTGGKMFIKLDSQTKVGLEGAEFVVIQGEKYAKFANNKDGYVFVKWVNSQDEATKLVSGKDGRFAIKGLKDGEYKLEETQVSDDKYVMLDKPIDFTIKHGTYETEVVTVLNIPKGLLPSTGGMGIYFFVVISALIMTVSIIWYRKNQRRQLV